MLSLSNCHHLKTLLKTFFGQHIYAYSNTEALLALKCIICLLQQFPLNLFNDYWVCLLTSIVKLNNQYNIFWVYLQFGDVCVTSQKLEERQTLWMCLSEIAVLLKHMHWLNFGAAHWCCFKQMFTLICLFIAVCLHQQTDNPRASIDRAIR